ncbi:HsdM family class I SAM-dependent methyltransferase [Algoriphagus aquimarinus]|uniref:site-specific DNA-methyltransferase (adenine-specific) n=1 Tax=Algoriphagus aquimarinus TaxID=237018 RepID=A0A1I0Y389_9BACT|nr:class I SAM-dependent DNA methyltransferase [Algoriphagus aquimarinus]SFB07357.1 type I restriction enzyme M protein [Algoriphagus aquimarinus]
MTDNHLFESKTKLLIDGLKSTCANYGLGNDGNEFKIITQVFLYKFLNDKFIYELKKLKPNLAAAEHLDEAIRMIPEAEYELLMLQLNEGTARLQPEQFISRLYQRQSEPKFSEIFDNTLLAIAKENSDIFSVITEEGEKIVLFENISKYITDKRDDFCKSIINKLVHFSFEEIFKEKFDFFATIFEYLIKDYNTNSGGKYAEYFTPHAVSKIMARCLVQDEVSNVSCYDPSAGSGTLLMNLAHQIGEDRCMIYSQDISQKSSNLLRLNLILNNLVHSIPNIVKGNTILEPYHKKADGHLQKFDYIVSNPPFKLDFSDFVADLDTKQNNERFFAGIPNVPAKKLESMAIYLMFLQHIMYSLSPTGKAAIVVPTGFITAQSGIEKKIRERMVKDKMLAGVVSMPSNIFATTGTNVSVIFLDKQNKGDVILIDASNLGTTVKEGKNQKTLLSTAEEDRIIATFSEKKAEEDFSVLVSYDEIEAKNYSLSAGQYFEVKIEYVDITQDEFQAKLGSYQQNLALLFADSKDLEIEIHENLKGLKYA